MSIYELMWLPFLGYVFYCLLKGILFKLLTGPVIERIIDPIYDFLTGKLIVVSMKLHAVMKWRVGRIARLDNKLNKVKHLHDGHDKLYLSMQQKWLWAAQIIVYVAVWIIAMVTWSGLVQSEGLAKDIYAFLWIGTLIAIARISSKLLDWRLLLQDIKNFEAYREKIERRKEKLKEGIRN